MKSIKTLLACSAIAVAVLSVGPTARANVYATNIKLNGSMTNVVASQGSGVNISYILNEPATAGVSIKIRSGATTVRTITIASGSAGTLKGLNTVVWDGKNDASNNVPLGSYSASITAGATGFADWTQTSDDSNTNNYVNRGRAVGVVKDTNSPYYGRIFVSNAHVGANPATVPGDQIGILKFNADGSYADEGGFGTGGYAMVDDGGDCPLRIKIAEDGRLYFEDWSGNGKIIATDLTLSTNQVVLDAPNYSTNPYGGNWQCFDIKFFGTNGTVWMGDGTYPGPAGIYYWHMTNGVADPNDTSGTQAVQAGGDLTLLAQSGIWIDNNTNIFIYQGRGNVGDQNPRGLLFSGFDGTNALYTGAIWSVGGGDDTFRNGWDMEGDNRANPHYLAYASSGAPGGIRILNAADGSTVVSNLTLGTFYRAVSWDNVGNLYTASQTPLFRWRVFSPPGTNQAMTVAFPAVQVIAAVVKPNITKIGASAGTVTINFTGGASDVASAFTLQSSSIVSGTYVDVASAVITQVSPGFFEATVATAGSSQFYRIKR